jgi:hypothetical protein
MSVISDIEINSIGRTYCYCCSETNINTSLVDKSNTYATCPIDGCIDCSYSSISAMYYCNIHNILFEVHHPHCLMGDMNDVFYVKMITEYTYAAQNVTKIPVFDSFAGMETLFTAADIVIVEKKCFCRNIVYCVNAGVTDDPRILATCPDSIV